MDDIRLVECSKILCDQSYNKSREHFTHESCHSLAADIQEHGQLQNVLITPYNQDGYEYRLVFGFRRYVAIAIVLAQDKIVAKIKTYADSAEADIDNVKENLERQTCTFFEECLSLNRVFGPEVSQAEIARRMQRSRAWVRNRTMLFGLPESTIEQVRLGALSAADVNLLIQQSPEEVVAATEKILAGKAAGEATSDMEGELSNRRSPRKKKDVQRVMTVLMGAGCEREMQTLRFAAGEISDAQLFEYLGINNVPQD